MIANENVNSIVLACLLLIHEREIQHQQAVTVVAAKVTRSEYLRSKYLSSVEEWLPSKSQYVSYGEVCSEEIHYN